MAMKTREQIYRQEAASLLRDVTTYHYAKGEQLKRLYPGKEEKIEHLLGYFVKQGRIFYRSDKDIYFDDPDVVIDTEMIATLWVLADFGDKYEYHSTDDYPTKIVFFAEGETYEIVYVTPGREALILHAMGMLKYGDGGRKILIVDDVSQF